MAQTKDMNALVRSYAREAVRPDGLPYESLDLEGTAELAMNLGVSLGDAERHALRQGVLPERYIRMLDAFSVADLFRIRSSRIVIVGLGGLGGTALDILARSGVGYITGADGDRFETSNLNRQLLSSMDAISRPKAELAAERVERVNPSVEFTGVEDYLDKQSMLRLFKEADLAVDCLGGLDNRLDVHQAAAEASIPLVTAALAGWSGYVGSVFPGEAGPAELFPVGSAAAEDNLGCPAPTVSFAASLQAKEVLRILSQEKAGPVPFLFFDLMEQSYDLVRLASPGE